MTTEEKRKVLDKLCHEYMTCFDGCPLQGVPCRCGRGAYFTKGADELTYMTDDEINAAYDIAFHSHPVKTREEYFREITSRMGGESGECLDIIKKHFFQGHDLDREHLAEEPDDVAWYLAVTAYGHGYDLETILKMNVDKL